jgi:hypothetical protein
MLRATVVDEVSVPDVPVMVTVTGPPSAAVLAAANVRTLDAVAGLVEKLAVTPLGKPVADRVTALPNPLADTTLIVSAPLLPWATDSADAEPVSVKLGGGLTVRAIVVDAVSAPEVPLIVTVTGPPVTAVALAESVRTLDAVAGLVAKDAVTPLGRPVAASITPPANPFAPFTEIVAVPPLPCVTDNVDVDDVRVKLGGGFTVSAIVVEADSAPDVPVTVTVDAPAVAVLDAENVTTLDPVAGLVANAAVTPLGRPVPASVTALLKPPTPVIETVLVPVLP